MPDPRHGLLLDLTRRYSEPHRHYHTLEHIADMLHAGRTAGLSDEQVMAIWFHDAIYDPRANDNEERSAVLAERLLAAEGWSREPLALVARIVRDTKAHTPTIPEASLVIDLDLMSLACSWPRFAENTLRIRREYAHVPDADFRHGRSAFFTGMLAQPRIFWTAFGAPLESPARANLTRALREG